MHRLLIPLGMLLLLITGCASSGPVHHLAADAALIKPGQSTADDVLRYLGQPNGRRALGPGVEQYVYSQQQVSTLAKVPYLGSWLGERTSEVLIVTIKNGLVTHCEFHQSSASDRDWADDFTWEKVQ